jgi:hypothetical protein
MGSSFGFDPQCGRSVGDQRREEIGIVDRNPNERVNLKPQRKSAARAPADW